MKAFQLNIPFKVAVAALIAILVSSIILLTCRNRKEVAVLLRPSQTEIDQAGKAKKEHDLFVDSVGKKITMLQKQKDSVVGVVAKKDAEINLKTQKIAALSRQATVARQSSDELLFIQTCDSLVPQVNDLVQAVDQLQMDNRNVQDAYDSLLGATSLKSARLEYDYSELNDRFQRFTSMSHDAFTKAAKYQRKADRRLIIGPQGGVTYDFIGGRLIPYIGAGITWRIIRL